MELRKGYKQTEVGVIPEDWQLKRVEEIFSFYPTSNYSKAQMSLYGEVGCIHYGLIHAIPNSSYNVKKGIKYYITKEQAKYEIVKDGDVLMVDASEDFEGVNKSVELLGIDEKKFIAGLHTFLLRDTNSLLVNRYRGTILNSLIVKSQLLRLAVGMKVYGVSKPQLKTVLIPVPPLSEQTAIAHALSDMDALISSLEQLIEKKKAIKQGAIQQLLKPKDGWVTKALGDVFQFKQGVQCPIEDQKLQWEKGLRRFIRIVDLTQPGEIPRYIRDPGLAHHVEKDDLFMVRYGNPGLLGYGYQGVIANNLFRLLPKFDLVNNFFYHLLCFHNADIMQLSSSTTMAALNFGSLKSLEINYPVRKNDQNEISKFLNDFDSELNALSIKALKAKEIKQAMMQVLLTGKIRLI